MEGKGRGESHAPDVGVRRMARDATGEGRVEQRELDERRYNIDYIERFTTKLFTMQHGTLPPNHPAQRAIEDALIRCRKENTHLPKILVLPEWKDVNAAAIGKDTIIVSLELMRFCRTYEAIVGVVGHERQHLETGDPFEPLREDAHERESSIEPGGIVKDAATRYADKIGRSRLFEVRSDLQGATAKLDEAGVSPMGYREFLHDLDTHTRGDKKYEPDIAHGSPADRMLAIGFLMRYFDFSSSSKDLTHIDAATKEAWSEYPTSGAAWAFRSTMDAGDTNKYRRLAHESRIAWFETLPFEEQIFCSGVLRHHAQFARGDVKERERREAWMKHVDDRMTTLIKERLREADPQVVQTALEAFRCFVLGNSSDPKIYAGEHWLATDIAKRQGAHHYRESIAALLPHVGEYTFGDSRQFMRELGSTFSEAVDDETFVAWLAMVDDTARITCAFFEGRSGELRTSEELACYTLREALVHVRFSKISQEEKNRFRDRFATELAARGQPMEKKSPHNETVQDDSEVIAKFDSDAVCQQVIKQIESLEKVKTNISSFIERTGVLVEDITDVEGIGKYFGMAYSLVKNAILKGYGTLDSKGISLHARTLEEEDLVQRFLLVNILSAYDTATEQHSLFAHYAAIDRLLSRFSFRAQYGLYEHDPTDDGYKRNPADLVMEREVVVALGNETDEIALRVLQQAVNRDLSPSIRRRFFNVALQDLSYRLSETPPDQFFARMDAFAVVGISPDVILKQDVLVHGRLVQHILRHIDTFVTRGEDIRALGLVATLSVDPWVAQMMRRAVAQRTWSVAPDFTEKVRIAFDTEHAGINLAERVIEGDMQTETQVAEVRSAAQRAIDGMFTESARVGWLALSEYIDVRKHEPLEMLDMLLKTQQDDRKIKDAIADQVFFSRFDNPLTKQDADSPEYQKIATERLATADAAFRSLYAIDQPTRLFIVKRLLVDSGIIREKKTRAQALEMLLSHVLPYKNQDTDLVMRTWVEHTVRALADVEDWETVFYAIGPLLADRICLPCKDPVPWGDIHQVEEHIDSAFDLENFAQQDLNTIARDTTREDYLHNANRYLYQADLATRAWLDLSGLPSSERIDSSSLALVRSTAERLGALPVRWLQVGKHYVKFSPQHEREFSGIFNEVAGQTKLAAVSVVEREWPEMWDYVRYFGNRIGGGSLMSVYKVELFKGGFRAMRVCNPNIQTNLGATSNAFRQTVQALAARSVLKPDQRNAIDSSVDLVEEWIRRDISFEDSRARDTKFHATHHGRDEGFGYRIRIPVPDGPESRFFQMDEFVEGMDLTDWTELANRHDMSNVVKTLARNFGMQIATGLLHPDLHPGNIRITENNELVYLDRSFLLDLSLKEQFAISSLFVSTPNVDPLRDLLKDGLEASQHAALDKVLTQAMGSEISDLAGTVRSMLGSLRDIGVRLPLSLILLMRNADAIDGYAKKAGLRGMRDAFN
ncbi:MAG: AarF/UbiB family protein [Patescibacteria group bacterium]